MRICLVSETWSPDINGVAHTLRLGRRLTETWLEWIEEVMEEASDPQAR